MTGITSTTSTREIGLYIMKRRTAFETRRMGEKKGASRYGNVYTEQSCTMIVLWSRFKPLNTAYATHPGLSPPRCNLHFRSYVKSHGVCACSETYCTVGRLPLLSDADK